MSEWRETTLGSVCELKRGYDLPARERVDGGVPIVSSSGITGHHVTAKVRGPGVVTGRYGTLGEVFFIAEDFWPLNTALYVRDFKGNDPHFVAALLRSLDLGKNDGAAAVPGINRNQLHLLPVRYPDTDTQSRIGLVLSTLDALIRNDRRRIDVLEQMAQAIYHEWFVRFRYPDHESVPLVDSALGPIPDGWHVTTLGECSTALVDGDWIETKDQGGSAYRLLQVSNIAVGGFRETGNYRYVTEETFRRLRCTEIKIGDLLISRMPDPVGRAWLVDHLAEPAITAVDVAILTPSSPAMGSYLDKVLNSDQQLAHAEAVATGTTRKRITRTVLGQSSVLAPPSQLLNSYHRCVSDGAALYGRLRLASAALSAMRDLLLPRLVTGQTDVSWLDLDT